MVRTSLTIKVHSEEDRTRYAVRKIEVESVFGNVKQNLGYRRMPFRGLEKVKVERGWAGIVLIIGERLWRSIATKTQMIGNKRKSVETIAAIVSTDFYLEVLGQPLHISKNFVFDAYYVAICIMKQISC